MGTLSHSLFARSIRLKDYTDQNSPIASQSLLALIVHHNSVFYNNLHLHKDLRLLMD